MRCLLWSLLGLVVMSSTQAAEILAISPIAGASHWNFMSSILEVLLSRGHKITVVTTFSRSVPHENYTEINISKLVPIAIASPWETVIGTYKPPTRCHQFLNDVHWRTCNVVFEHSEMQLLLRRERPFDLVITELLASLCDMYLAAHLGALHVAIVSSPMLTWYHGAFGSATNPSYVATLHTPLPAPRSFLERLRNTVDYATITAYARYVDAGATAAGRDRFGNHHPDAEALLRNVSLVFLNTHSSFNLYSPSATNVKEIGGVHLKPPRPLPDDLQTFIDSAENGVIYFNLGSVVKMKELPISIQNGIKDGFKELPQKILWKFESDEPMKDQPKNVFIRKWFPQYDVIRHPNVKLFITHGGNSGTLEAVSAGIPVLGIPIYFDQPRNLELFQHWGSGLYVDHNNFTREDFVNKIKRILNDHRFKENAKALSQRFHDRPVSPQDTVIYWIEYVLRHKGAHYLKSPAVHVEWYQYYLLDFFGLAITIVASIFFFFYSVISILVFK